MCNFLKCQILWCIVTSEIPKPTKKKDWDEEKFTKRLKKCYGKNHQISIWFCNTCANVIKLDFYQFDTTKEV